MGNERKRIKALLHRAQQAGWGISMAGNGHYRLQPTDRNIRLIFLSSSASEYRSWINALKECERNGLNVDGL
jgi:hypothetical protein